jgi:alkanesulfonate monooxygenase SsuD/methylene tetrahydromethanopterin reductase-like flavin-dependent oxidoreductase (luciferase family)
MASTFPRGFTVGFKTSPQSVGWSQLDETWAAAGELEVFAAGWLNDHLTDMTDAGGPSLEALTLLSTMLHRVPGKWVGHAVLSNTFRRPPVLAKAATVLDHATGGRFVLGLGAGWQEFEHRSFGIPMPPIGERIDRLVSAVAVLRALFSADAASAPGVTRPDRFYPLENATNEPMPLTPGGPPIFLGGQGPRGIGLAGRAAHGWLLPGINAGDEAYFRTKRDLLLATLHAAGRSDEGFAFVGQVQCDLSHLPKALREARALRSAGATHMILGLPPSAGPAGLRQVARKIAEPLLSEA